MRTIVFTGNGGPGVTTAAAASALRAAHQGRRTLLLSIGPDHTLGAALEADLGDEARAVAPNLDAILVDVGREMAAYYELLRPLLPPQAPQLSPDELPLPPGFDVFCALYRLDKLAPHYELAVVDAGPFGALLRALSLPDAARWLLRILVGLDRGAGADPRSTLRALLPVAFMPPTQLDQAQDTRVELERLRDLLSVEQGASLRWVLRPDPAGLAEARVAIPALQLHSLLVEALVAAPTLPADIADPRLTPLAESEREVAAEAAQTWQPRPLIPLPWQLRRSGLAALAEVGEHMYGALSPDTWLYELPPIEPHRGGQPSLLLRLPGLPRGELGVTISGDEAIVRVGPYRRHLLLPEGLRSTAVRASREGEALVLRPKA
jgi:arsenite/tail-anchored protein-transporting ATPase